MHIIRVKVNDYYVSYEIESVNNEIQIVAHFVKDGERIHSVYKIGNGGVDTIVKLTNRDYAIRMSEEIIRESNKSKHSPFK